MQQSICLWIRLRRILHFSETAGIGHPGQPYRLQAICRSLARCMQLETPTLHFAACKLLRFVRQVTARRCCYLSALIPASRGLVYPPTSTKIQNHPMKLGGFVFLVETAGIGHPGQPWRLHAPCHSWARRMRLETPTRPASRGFDSH